MQPDKNDFHFVPLDEHYNLDGAATAKDSSRGKLDGQYSLRAEELPEAGPVHLLDVPFAFPSMSDGRNNCLVPEGQRIETPRESFSAAYILGNSVLGSSASEIELEFDGHEGKEKADELLQFTDWCHAPQFGEFEAVRANYRYCGSGLAAPANSIWLQVILLPRSKKLCALTLGRSPNMRIFCITLGRGRYQSSPASMLYYLLSRLGLRNEAASRWSALYHSLVDLNALCPCKPVADGLRKIQAEFLEHISFEDLHAYDEEKVSQCIEKFLPRLEAIKEQAKAGTGGGGGAAALDITLSGHSHLDAVWLWPWDETIEKAYRTFSRNLKRLDLYPRATFNQSSPQFYAWMERYYPEVFEGIKKKVEAGRWEPVGGMWVESDGYMPCGEALVRQRLYGQRYYLSRFGRISEVAWIPDTFGMHANHPQIIRKTGGKYFFTTKLAWNYENRFPYQHFVWEAPDGSRVLALQDAVGCGASPGPHEGLEERIRKHNILLAPGKEAKVNYRDPHVPDALKSDDTIPEVLVIYGEGDGGEGPSDKMFLRAETLTMLPGYRHGTVHEHFRAVEKKYIDRLPVWNDELYLENHRGTTSSQGRIKELNRRGETALLAAEKWATLSRALGGYKPDKAETDRIWRKLLFNQFHDILPGTSIPQAYVDAEPEFEDILRTADRIRERAQRSVLAGLAEPCGEGAGGHEKRFGTGRPLYLFNALSWARDEVVSIPWGFPWVRVVDTRGTEIPSQVIYRDGRHLLLFQARVPAFGYTTVRLMAGEKPAPAGSDGVQVRDRTLENRFYHLELDGNGDIRQIYDKALKRNLLSGPANHVHFFRNRPKEWSNWNINPEYEKHELIPKGKAGIEVLDAGPVVGALRITRPAAEGGKLAQEVRLYRDDRRIDFITEVDVAYRESLVKASFPFDVGADFVTTEIAYGTHRRPTRPRNSFEKAQWEVWTQKWLDLSGPEAGVTMATRTRYGFDAKGDRIRLTLVKGGIEPDPNTDVFTHRIEYGLFSHGGTMAAAHAWRRGFEYNDPIVPLFEEDPELRVAPGLAFFTVSPDNVCLEAFKPEEDGEGLVIRVYEVEGRNTGRVELTLPFPIRRAEEIDFLELAVLEELAAEEKRVAFPLGPHEIKAIRIFPRGLRW